MVDLDISIPVHASCVAVEGRAVLICGASRSGKSALALELMAFGAMLVADDRTILTNGNGQLFAKAPQQISGQIEARGVGVLSAATVADVPIALVVDMDQVETDRLPIFREVTIAGCKLPLLHRVTQVHFGSAILQMLRYGRNEPRDD